MSNLESGTLLHPFKLVVGKWLLWTCAISLLFVAVASQFRLGKGDPPLGEWISILWTLGTSLYFPLVVLGASQYEIDGWKRTAKHETYKWAGLVAKWSAIVASWLMVLWFGKIAFFDSHGSTGPSGEFVPEADYLLSTRTGFFCSVESLFVLTSLSSGIFAEPAGTGRKTSA